MENPKVHCYGSSAAITVEAVYNSNSSTNTVNIDIAKVSNRKAQWQYKTTLQAMSKELPLVCAVFLGFLPLVRIEREGKWLVIERQQNQIFIKGGSSSVCALPISPGDSFLISDLLLSQLKKNSYSPDAMILASIRSAAKLYEAQALNLLQQQRAS